MFLLFASQSKANFLAKGSITGYIINNDLRLKHIRDFLHNVKAAEIQCLQGRFMEKIEWCRQKQLDSLKTYLRLTFCFFSSMNQMIPAITATTALAVYWGTGHQLEAQTIFPILALFDLMYQPAGKLSVSVTRQFSILPSMRRILSVLGAEEAIAQKPDPPVNTENAIELVEFEAGYPENQSEDDRAVHDLTMPFTLGPISVAIPRGKLTAVVGPVGSGKTTLLMAMFGYITPKHSTSLRRQGSIASYSQQPWIKSSTVRDNIVFMRELDKPRYRKVVRACCLEQDFTAWPAGDRTVVGEKGTTVSGGQRARISLARAIYSEADIILLDDPLAAVDAHVGSQLFKNCLGELHQTVVLGTGFPTTSRSMLTFHQSHIKHHFSPSVTSLLYWPKVGLWNQVRKKPFSAPRLATQDP